MEIVKVKEFKERQNKKQPQFMVLLRSDMNVEELTVSVVEKVIRLKDKRAFYINQLFKASRPGGKTRILHFHEDNIHVKMSIYRGTVTIQIDDMDSFIVGF